MHEPPSSGPPAADGKKPVSTMAKVGIGCGIAAILGVVLAVLLVGMCTKKLGDVAKDFSANPERAAAEMIVKLNPDIELVKTDDAAQTITYRDKATGKETTISWSDLKEGKLTMTDSEGGEISLGGTDLSSVPEWVPRLPETTQVLTTHRAVDQGKASGSYAVSTSMQTPAIETFIEEKAAALEMERTNDRRMGDANQEMRILGYQGGGRTFTVSIVRGADGVAQVQFLYEEATGP
jgi:hypothetical protein